MDSRARACARARAAAITPNPLSLSHTHTRALAGHGRVHPERGVGLRFPRFLRSRVGEKNPTDATSSGMVIHMFRQQATVKGDADDDEDD